MTKRLENLFDLAPMTNEDEQEIEQTPPESFVVQNKVTEAKNTLALITEALPAVRELEKIDAELDELAAKAMEQFTELTDLGMQVDSRFAAEIFSVASSMMGHALSAKTAKASRKMKTIEMQMKKIRLEHDMAKKVDIPRPGAPLPGAPVEMGEGQVLSRNELMAMLNVKPPTTEQ